MTAGRLRRAAAVGAFAGLTLSACAQQQDLAICDGEVDRVEVFNLYADHPHADLQVVDDPAQLAFACSDLWNYPGLRVRTFDADDLSERSATILVLHREDGTRRTIWAHRLAGADAGTALLTDDGRSLFLPNQGLPHYYGPDAEPVERDAVPERADSGA